MSRGTLMLLLSIITFSLAKHIVPGAYIVELDPHFAGLNKRSTESEAQASAAHAIAQLTSVGLNVLHTRQVFSSSPHVFYGFSIQMDANTPISTIANLPGVKGVWPVTTVKRAMPIGMKQARKSYKPVLDSDANELAQREVAGKDRFSPHRMTGVNETQAAGLVGEGILVCVIDTGIDYTLPALGGCFGQGCRVRVGYDFVGNNWNQTDPTSKPEEGPDPMDVDGHGTHVAGIIAASPNFYGFTGVSMNATLGGYRIFAADGASSADITVAALLRAHKDGCNVVNLSIGESSSWTSSDKDAQIIDALAKEGLHAFISQGNEGNEGAFFSSNPANNLLASAIGSVDVRDTIGYRARVQADGQTVVDLNYFSSTPFNLSRGLPIKTFLSNNDTDACEPVQDDLSGYVVLIRGNTECGTGAQVKNLADAGAEYVVLAPREAGSPRFLDRIRDSMQGIADLAYDDGQKLLDLYESAGNLTWMSSIMPPLQNLTDIYNGGFMSPFSNFGPTHDLNGLPAFSTPGGRILSCFPTSQSPQGVVVASGTSMASPFAAGAAAVVLSARSNESLSPGELRSILATTSKPLTLSKNITVLNSVLKQGGGLIQVDKAVTARTRLEPFHFNLNDTRNFVGTHNLRLINKGSVLLNYTLSHRPALAFGTFNESIADIVPTEAPPIMLKLHANVTFNATTLALGPGDSAVVQLNFSAPDASPELAARYPLYSGYIRVREQDGQTYHVGYNGLLGAMFDFPIFDTTNTTGEGPYPLLRDESDDELVEESTWSYEDGPNLWLRFAFGTRRFTVDLVESDVAFQPTIDSTDVEKSESIPYQEPPLDTPNVEKRQVDDTNKEELFDSTPIVARLIERFNVSRDFVYGQLPGGDYGSSSETIAINGTLSNGTRLPEGTPYRLLLRALKLNSNEDARLESQYESWLSPVFQFVSNQQQ